MSLKGQLKSNRVDTGLASLGIAPIHGDRIPSMIYVCQRCDLIWQATNYLDPAVARRLDRMFTVLPENEEEVLKRRGGYFRCEFRGLNRLVEQDSRSPVVFADIGCSYGHLLDIAHQAGWQVAGVDASKTLIEHIAPRKSYPLFAALLPKDPLPFPDSSLDLITFYDSFYMFEDPISLLNQVYEKLKPGGYLLLRLTNRNRYVRLWFFVQRLLKRLRMSHEIDAMAIFGDQKYSYSPKSFAQVLKLSKFRGAKMRIRLLERGKKELSVVTRLVYIVSLLLSWTVLKKVVLTPSFTVVVRKEAP